MSKESNNFPTINLTDYIIVRKTDEKYAKDLVQYWKEGGMTSLSVSLNCPISKTRLEIPCRGEDCTHIQCFDGLNFLKMNEKQFGKWLCSICQKPSPLNKLFVDGFFLDILKAVSDDVEDIYFDMNGNWSDSKPDSETSELDYTVIDLSETLQVIDLTGSDDEYDNNETTGSADVVSSKELDNPAKVGCKDKELDNSANKLDKNQTTAGTSKKGTDGLDNTAVDACPTENEEVSNKTKETKGEKDDKQKTDPKGNRDRIKNNNKENDNMTWCQDLNTNERALRSRRYKNKTSGLPYARQYPHRQCKSYNMNWNRQQRGFRKPLHNYNPYFNGDYMNSLCIQRLSDFGNGGNFSIRIEL